MAQRNPMNDRYTGDGPGGQTRKSAARAKPVSQAASSVHIRKKPQTAAEKRAAQKSREKEIAAKAAERARKKADRERAEAEARGEVIEGLKRPKGLLGKLYDAGQASGAAANIPKPTSNDSNQTRRLPELPQTQEYRKWRRVYWILLLIGSVFIVGALWYSSQTNGQVGSEWIAILFLAYAPIIAAFFIDFKKVKPIVKAHQKNLATSNGNKSPKQLKHEQEAAERAQAIEAARKAAKAAKRAPRRKKDTVVLDEAQDASANVQDASADMSGDVQDASVVVPGQGSEVLVPGQE